MRMTIKGAAREYGVPAVTLELAIARGALRAIHVDGQPRVLRSDMELFVKRMVKRGAGNKVITRLNPDQKTNANAVASNAARNGAGTDGH